MMDPIILHYGKGQLTGFLVDPNGVLDVVSFCSNVVAVILPLYGVLNDQRKLLSA